MPGKKRKRSAKEIPDKRKRALVAAEGGDGSPALDALESCLRGVVKIFCTTTKPNYQMPWQMQAQKSYAGTGCLIQGNQILTNAHVVEFGTTISVLKHGDPKRYLAKVVRYGHDYDLALLQVVEEEKAFWENTVLLQMGPLPELNSSVTILGYPSDMDSVSVTEGVISRVMMDKYQHSGQELLKLQVDAAVNPGNSGGPALVDGFLIGVVSELMAHSQNIGFAIPSTVVRHFLQNVGNKGICTLGIQVTSAENQSLRAFHKMSVRDHGVLVTKVFPMSPCFRHLVAGDIVLSVNGHLVADDGTTELREGTGERISFAHVVASALPGSKLKIEYLRLGTRSVCDILLTGERVGFRKFSYGPQPYMVWAGMVFVHCSTQYLISEFYDDQGDEKEMMPLSLQSRWVLGHRLRPDQELIVMSQVLADDMSRGYLEHRNLVLTRVNDEPVPNLKALRARLSDVKSEFVRFEFVDGETTLVYRVKDVMQANSGIWERNGISRPFVTD